MRPAPLFALLAVLGACAPAFAGPLVSASLHVTLAPGGGAPLTVTAPSTAATGTLSGSAFRLDAGSWFAGPHSAASGNFSAVLTLGANGALSGTLGQATISPAAGLPFGARLKLGSATLLSIGGWPLGERTSYAHVAFPTPAPAGLIRPATHGFPSSGFRGDPWHLGPVTQDRLTVGGKPLPTVATTGGVSVTPAGNVHVTLVSLSRIHRVEAFSSGSYRLPLAARLELVFLPEPSAATFWLAATGALAAGALRRRSA